MFAQAGLSLCLMMSLSTIAIAQMPPSEGKSAPSAQADSQTNMLPPAIGDHWTYEVRDNISGDLKGDLTQTITDISGEEFSIRNLYLGAANPAYFVYDRLWDLKDNALWKFSPNDAEGIKESMKAGDTWIVKANDVKDGRVVWKRTSTSKVTGEESITTQAGTFNAIKYETTIHVQGALDPTKKWDIAITAWYVPSVDHWVKRTEKMKSDGHVRNDTTVELVDFGRQ
jgi:hypothetical protein